MAWHFDASSIEPQQTPQQPGGSFYGLGIAPKILEALTKLSFTVPTPIQHKAIPQAIEGKDMIGVAQTGTGKTLAFAIPIIQRLAQGRGRCLVLAPTRELAIQIDETFRKISPVFGIKTAVLIGGAPMGLQIQALRKGPRVIIATPGRLVDHMERNTIMMADVNILVLDEADRMLDMGFLPSIERIIKAIPRERQTLLFSATIPTDIMKIATQHMKLPISVEVAPSGTTVESVTQELFIVRKESKRRLLEKILIQYQGSVLLFTRTRIGAKKTMRMIRDMGHKAAEIHSDRTLGQRKEALEGFKNGRYRILVATDIAARGIDVAGIELVINFDLPEESENYVHRIGRTARAGLKGRAISFATPDQGPDVKNIERLIKAAIPVTEHPELPKETFIQGSGHGSSGYRPRYGNRGGYSGGHGKKPGGGSHGYGKSRDFRSSQPKHSYNKNAGHGHSGQSSQSSHGSQSGGFGEKRPYSPGPRHEYGPKREFGPSHSHGPSHSEKHGQAPHHKPGDNQSFSKFRRPAR
ncbi:MAG: DEAD/DEAH box helicase [Candidatus Omnitrophica bacterium]|nr:DEAD/DEAH box helicase [Candidatus Omnitrophota bacterium]